MEAAATTRTQPLLRVEIEAEWTARDIAATFNDLSRLHDFAFAFWESDDPDTIRALNDRSEGGFLGRVSSMFSEHGPLSPAARRRVELDVVRIEYASPGFADFAGVGKTVEQLRLFLQYLIDLAVWRDHRRAAVAKSEAEIKQIESEVRRIDEEVIAKRIENVRTLLNLSQEAEQRGFRYDELRDLFIEVEGIQSRMLRRVDQKQITSVRVLDPELDE